MRSRAGRALLLLAGALLALSACNLDLDVRVEVEPDGSGRVEVVAVVDPDGLTRIGGDLGAVLALDDLRAAGWTVEGPTNRPDGSGEVRLAQRFADPEAADAVFDDLASGSGLFRGFGVARERSLLRTRWEFRGTVDLGGEVAVSEAVGEEAAATLAELEQRLGDSLERILRLRVGVRLPGDVSSNATTKAENGAVWQVGFGGAPLELEATGTSTRTGVVVLGAIGAVLALVAVVVLLVRLAGRVRTPERATGSGRGAP